MSKVADGYFRGGNVRGGTLFGEPTVKPRLYRCPSHGAIPSSHIEWQGTEPHCPTCGQSLRLEETKE